jgi:hypothetical protein
MLLWMGSEWSELQHTWTYHDVWSVCIWLAVLLLLYHATITAAAQTISLVCMHALLDFKKASAAGCISPHASDPADPTDQQKEQEMFQWAVNTPRQLQPKAGRGRRIVEPPKGSRPRRIVRNPIEDKGNPGTFIPTPVLTPQEAVSIVDHHNALRGIHQAQPLVWDDTLAAQVEEYAAKCSMAPGANAESMYATSRVNDVAGALKDAVKAW